MDVARRLVGFLFCACSAAAVGVSPAPPLGKLPDTAEPLQYALEFRIDPAAEGFSATADIRIALKRPAERIWLHASDLQVERVEWRTVAGPAQPARFASVGDSGVAAVEFGQTVPPQELQLRFVYRARYNSRLEGVYRTRRAGQPYVITQMEPVSARRAFPGFDEPRFKTPFALSLVIPAGLQAVANTAQSAEQTLPDGSRRVTFRTTPELPTYLLAFAVGPWDVVDAKPIAATAWRKNALPLRAIAPHGEGPRLAEALAATPAIVTALEDYFGYAYAFGKLDLLAAPDFSAGAMENPGLVIFRESLLLLDANTPAQLRRASFEVNAHELAHQWFGDTVTMPWWDDLWLNEAFATWMERRITQTLRPAQRADLRGIASAQQAMAADSLAGARRVRQPIRDNGDIEGAFDSLTYGKGAAVLGMFEAWVGERPFRDGLRRYLREHAFANATSDDLIAALQRAGDKGAAFGTAMRSFLDQPGVPLVRSELRCDGGKARLRLSQQRYFPLGSGGEAAAQTWGIPLCVRSGKGAASAVQCQLFDRPEAEMILDGGCPDWYLPNADARGYYRVALAARDLAALTRVAARLGDREQLAFADAIKAGFERGDVDAAGVLDAIGQLAGATTREAAFALQAELVWIRTHLADAAARAAVDAYVVQLYLPRLQALGYLRRAGESEEAALLRADLVELLARKVESKPVRTALLAQGKAVLAGDGKGRLRFGAANYDLLGTVLAVTVQELGAPAIDALIAELARTGDANLRLSMAMALGATTDPAQGERVREFAIGDATQVSETARVLGVHQYEPRNRAALWSWFQRRYAAVVAHTPVFVHGRLPELVAEGWCTREQAQQIVRFFARDAAKVGGTAQGLLRAEEAINLCAARREKHGAAALQRWVAARREADTAG
ncbi:M1 family metallopeptidase [Tahibacter caeni]|uniref:M1 family metallopeptidase n=1 Tax=Tahibacter caeni TaxID=1453545 RepID=UPI0021493393|nr:M1 family metallopeptidase [Tahibacter caeni]